MNKTKSRYWITSGLFTFFERFSALVFGFGSVFFLLRSFTKEEFGTWVLFLTITNIFEVGRVGLLQNALVKYLSSSEKSEHGKISTASITINVSLTLIAIVLFYVLAYPASRIWGRPEFIQMFHLYILTTIFLLPFHQFNFIQQANLSFKGVSWANFAKQGLLFLYIVILFFLDIKITLYNLVIVQMVAAILAALISYLFSKRFLIFSKEIDKEWIRKLIRYGKYAFGTNLSTMLYKSIDKMMLGMFPFTSTAAVGLYETAIKVTNLAEVPTFSMAAILFPQSAKRMSEGKESIKLLYEKAVGAILAILIPAIIFVLIFSEIIINIFAGSAYMEAAKILRVTIFYGLFIPFAVQFGTILDSIGKPKINFLFTLFGMLLNVIFNYFFIKSYGVIGAAYGTLSTYAITFVFMQIFLFKELNIITYRVFYYTFEFQKKALQFAYNFIKKK